MEEVDERRLAHSRSLIVYERTSYEYVYNRLREKRR